MPDICIQENIKLDDEIVNIINKEVNISICNLEGFINSVGNKEKGLGMNCDDFVEFAFKTKLKAVSIANNHIFDHGKRGLLKTISSLKKNKIDYFGTKEKPSLTIQIKGKKLSFLGSVWKLTGYKTRFLNSFNFSLDKQKDLTRKLVSDSTVFWLPHWGVDLELMPHPWQFNAAKVMLDNGVSVLYGCHPHFRQEIFQHNSKPVIFSGGTAVLPINTFTNYIPSDALCSYLLLIDLNDLSFEIIETYFDWIKNKLTFLRRIDYKNGFPDINSFLKNISQYKAYFRKNRNKKSSYLRIK